MSETLLLSRDLFVPRELVFEVWTEPEHLAQWYSPGPEFERTAAVDLRVGGAYALSWQGADAVTWTQSGNFEAIDAPAELIYSAELKMGDDPWLATRVTVRFADLDGGTRITIGDAGYPDRARQDVQMVGWQRALDQLEAYFSVI